MAATALAGGGASTVKDAKSVPAGAMETQVGSAKATCPKGETPVPAGLSVSLGADTTVLGLKVSDRTAKATLGQLLREQPEDHRGRLLLTRRRGQGPKQDGQVR